MGRRPKVVGGASARPLAWAASTLVYESLRPTSGNERFSLLFDPTRNGTLLALEMLSGGIFSARNFRYCSYHLPPTGSRAPRSGRRVRHAPCSFHAAL